MFQTRVGFNFTTGFVGEIVLDGPLRSKTGRIRSIAPIAGRDTANVVGRAYGYVGDVPLAGGKINAAMVPIVSVGGKNFAGLLINPKHYALQGTQAGGSLAPSLALPDGNEGEFADMVIVNAELINHTTGALTVAAGDHVAYVPSDVTDGNDALKLPIGALITYPKGTAMPTGYVEMPTAQVLNGVSIGASAAGALVSAVTIIQLTS